MRMMAFNTHLHNVCIEEGPVFAEMLLNFVGREYVFMRYGLHLTGKGVTVIVCEFVRVVDEGTGMVNYLN